MMGCCFSSSRANSHSQHPPSVVNAEGRASDSSHRVHHSAPNALAPANSPSASSHAVRPSADHLPLDEHFNAPIRRHVWYSKRRLWNRAQLDRERKDFFETRVTGRPEVWVALDAALSLLRADDLATAQTIIDAAGVTVPTGDVCQGCYDEQGVLYRLPQCIVSDPENMTQAGLVADDDDDDFDTDDGKLSSDEASGDELITEGIERRRDEKGKTSERDLIRVKARLSDRDGPDILITIGKTQNIALLARKIQQETKIPKSHRVRIAYLGKILKEHSPLVEQGWKPGHVVNALVVKRHPPP